MQSTEEINSSVHDTFMEKFEFSSKEIRISSKTSNVTGIKEEIQWVVNGHTVAKKSCSLCFSLRSVGVDMLLSVIYIESL